MQLRYGSALAAATLGQDGVLAWDGENFHHTPAFRVPVVDTTGAGDIFHAGFIYGLLQGWPLDRQLDFACAAAALNCKGTGARGGIEAVEEIERLIATNFRHRSAFNVKNHASNVNRPANNVKKHTNNVKDSAVYVIASE
jgi:sulfofructose kinase